MTPALVAAGAGVLGAVAAVLVSSITNFKILATAVCAGYMHFAPRHKRRPAGG
jgi:hypothetical protein